MSRGGAYAEGSTTFALAGLARPPFDERARQPPRQNEQCRCLFKATDHTPSRTPSIGLMLDLAARAGGIRATCYSRSLDAPSTLFKRRGHAPLCRGMSSRFALPCALLMRLSAHLDDARKMPLTDFCNRPFYYEHPTTVQLPSPQLALQRPPPHSSSGGLTPNVRGSTASDHLSAIRPRVG